jgi:hypothetical protein
MVIVGTIIWMIISGSVMAKIGKIVKGTKVAQAAGKGMQRVKNVVTTIGGTAKDSAKAGMAIAKAKVKNVVDKCSDGLAKRIRKGYGDEVVDCSDEVLGGAALRSSKYAGIADEIVNTKKLDEFLEASAGKFEWDPDTVLAFDKIISNYAGDSKKFDELITFAKKTDRIDGNEIETFIKSWGNSYGTGSKGLPGYEYQYEKLRGMLDNLDEGENINVGRYLKGELDDTMVNVECDILKNVKNKDLPEMYEYKSSKYLSKPGKSNAKLLEQIRKQASLIGDHVDSVTWIVKGKVSKPLADYIESYGITLICEGIA